MSTSSVGRQLEAWLSARTGSGSDEGLLERLLAGDEAAFEALVRRHGPVVFAVCHRVLGQEQDAEDAFQATFLVLWRKAHTIRPRHHLAGWLVGVAYRTARQVWRQAARRRARERAAGRSEVVLPPQNDEMAVVIDEVQHLPEEYRTVVVVCDLEGRPRRQAAELLGWPEGTVAGRLARARALLKRRLARRGIGDLASCLAPSLPGQLLRVTLDAVAQPEERMPAAIASLVEEVSRMMWMSRIKNGFVAFLTLSLVGVGLAAGAMTMEEPSSPGVKVARADRAAASAEKPRQQLPLTPAPTQALGSILAEDQVRVQRVRVSYRPVTTLLGDGNARTSYEQVIERSEEKFPLKDISAHGTDGKRIDAKELRKRLAREIPVLISLDGKPVSPLHLRLIKPGTIILVLPLPMPAASPLPPPVAPVVPADPAQAVPDATPVLPPPTVPDTVPPVQSTTPPHRTP